MTQAGASQALRETGSLCSLWSCLSIRSETSSLDCLLPCGACACMHRHAGRFHAHCISTHGLSSLWCFVYKGDMKNVLESPAGCHEGCAAGRCCSDNTSSFYDQRLESMFCVCDAAVCTSPPIAILRSCFLCANTSSSPGTHAQDHVHVCSDGLRGRACMAASLAGWQRNNLIYS